jgi:hypothetical protein
MMTTREKEDIKIMLEYFWEDEERHYQESLPCRKHIFVVLRRLAKSIEHQVV